MTIQADEVSFSSRADLRRWLSENYQRPKGLWAIFHKQSTGLSDLSWDALVEECLCVGWIDSVPGKVDDLRTKIYISPRKPGSGWSARNKAKIMELQALGLIEAPGIQAIESAKSSGSWTLFDLAEAQVVPEELSSVFAANRELKTAWDKLTDSQRKAKLQNFYLAKSDETKAKRVAEIIAALKI
jgi:uncharacterized protein YdeI (YjbR/CyaY-like superfamily)